MFPGPGKYDIRKEQEFYRSKRKFTMGEGREKIFLNGVHPEYSTKFNIPGPGFYSYKAERTKVGTKFGKSVTHDPDNTNFPGPGQYPLPAAISGNGKYMVSRYRGSGAPRIPILKSDGSPASRFTYTAGR